MKLKHIAAENCPTCGAATQAEERKDLHSCGEWNEYRTFTCGMMLHYSPNFNQTVEVKYNPCRNGSDHMEKMRKRKLVKKAIQDMVDQADTDDEFKVAFRYNTNHL